MTGLSVKCPGRTTSERPAMCSRMLTGENQEVSNAFESVVDRIGFKRWGEDPAGVVSTAFGHPCKLAGDPGDASYQCPLMGLRAFRCP
jgi:hypothetical protein